MSWILLVELIYLCLLILVCLRIIYDTRSSSKTIAYLFVAIALPVVGIIFYFSFGINYRKRKLYDSKLLSDEALLDSWRPHISRYSMAASLHQEPELKKNRELANLLVRDLRSVPTRNNSVKLLLNGEQKFPELLKAIESAKHHIHMEYYIFEDDEIGTVVAELLIKKAKEGVKVRLIYDDFGSRRIRRKLIPRMREAGVEAYPFHRIYFLMLANRMNYRNHRKIVVIDGCTGFTGGMNVSDNYLNKPDRKKYWRDMHVRIDGPGIYYLQYLFICDWQFCSGESLGADDMLLPPQSPIQSDTVVQIAASGPDSDQPAILYSMLQAINLAEKEILITTPYFIPGESLLHAISIAALSGLNVKLLVPYRSDSRIVNAAARSYYADLLDAGVEIYLYKKGFVHSKTLVADSMLTVIGSANMDYRSFELNFEVNAFIYDREIAGNMRSIFMKDIENAVRIDPEAWANRRFYKVLWEKVARMASPLM